MPYSYNGTEYETFTAMYRAKHSGDGGSASATGDTTTAASGTINAIVNDAGRASDYSNDSAGNVGGSVDAVTGPEGTVVRDDMTESQTNQRQTVVVGDGDNDGGGLVYTDGDSGQVVGTGPGGDEVLEDQEDGVTYDGYTSLGGTANPGDPIVITSHVHRETGDPDTIDERLVENRVRLVDVSDGSVVWEGSESSRVTATSEKHRLGTIDGLSEGRYRAVLTLDGERKDVSSVLTVGGGGPSYGGGLANQSGQNGGSSDSSGSDSTTTSSDSTAARVVSLPGGGGGAGGGVALLVLLAGAAYAATR